MVALAGAEVETVPAALSRAIDAATGSGSAADQPAGPMAAIALEPLLATT